MTKVLMNNLSASKKTTKTSTKKSSPHKIKEWGFYVFLFIVLFLLGVFPILLVTEPSWLPLKISFDGQARQEKKKTSQLAFNRTEEVRGEYQAVFLTNGQTYFGKLSQEDSDYPILKDVYYLKLSKSLQEQKEEATEGEKEMIRQLNTQQNITLIELGNELHGPTNEIKLNKDHILFIEDLRGDSRIVKAIEEYKGQQYGGP